jgi:hypothetical protein
MSCRWVCIALAVCGAAQAAEHGRVRIAPLPMKALTGDDRLDRELPKQFEVRLLGTGQVESPLREKVEAFLQTRAGAPCEKDVACLKTLAENTSSLYSLAVSMRLNGAGSAFVVAATLFRVDGKTKEIAFEYKVNRDTMTLTAAAEETLKELIARLELETLDRVLPMASSGHEEQPPVFVAPDPGATGHFAGKVVIGVGGATAVLGVIMLGASGGAMLGIPVMNGNVPLSRKGDEDLARGFQIAGGALLSLGVVMAAAGGVIYLMSPSAPAQVTVAPLNGGAALVVGGTW